MNAACVSKRAHLNIIFSANSVNAECTVCFQLNLKALLLSIVNQGIIKAFCRSKGQLRQEYAQQLGRTIFGIFFFAINFPNAIVTCIHNSTSICIISVSHTCCVTCAYDTLSSRTRIKHLVYRAEVLTYYAADIRAAADIAGIITCNKLTTISAN